MLVGLDTPNEWTEYLVYIPARTAPYLTIWSMGLQGSNQSLQLDLTPQGEGFPASYTFTVNGLGLGCGYWTGNAQTGNFVGQENTFFIARLTLLSGSTTYINNIYSIGYPTPASPTTWGAIKNLYR